MEGEPGSAPLLSHSRGELRRRGVELRMARQGVFHAAQRFLEMRALLKGETIAHAPPDHRSRWLLVADKARRQKGLVTRDQLLAIGIPEGTIDEWISASRLHPIFPRVYLVGHRLPGKWTLELAAVLACTPDSFLSHRSAAELWGLLEPVQGYLPQVMIVGRKSKGPTGIRVHCATELHADERSEVDDIPITSAARTLIDLAPQVDSVTFARAYEEGLIKSLFSRDEMVAMLQRHAGRRGIRKVRALVDRDAPPSVTYEEAHLQLLELIRSSELPHPETEAPIGRYRVDLLWARERLVVEMDGAAFHSTPERIERDKRRDAELAALGYLVIRVTWRQLRDEPENVLTRIAMTLGERRALFGINSQ